ncbi:hypothetical protein AQUSIP_18290 [Aquicella siphonis]|uniref:Uncharacterized protein n=1 Tax=Aquicella siphonis TaxID=254247 RepID=A0A5E4PJP4_9COXI|nr:hypothetical protein [Aquicella siphonis]VVC76516.1 hypothetical protein AQUSIP_18290 [Aquicella siphonis]
MYSRPREKGSRYSGSEKSRSHSSHSDSHSRKRKQSDYSDGKRPEYSLSPGHEKETYSEKENRHSSHDSFMHDGESRRESEKKKGKEVVSKKRKKLHDSHENEDQPVLSDHDYSTSRSDRHGHRAASSASKQTDTKRRRTETGYDSARNNGSHDEADKTSGGERYRASERQATQLVLPVRSAARNTVRAQTNPAQLFVGPYRDNYARLLDHSADRRFQEEDFRTLGRVSSNEKYYFDESGASIRNANAFLETFWSSAENRLATREFHQEKYDKTDRSKPLHPGCISFVMADINGKQHCFVTISGFHNASNNLRRRMQEFIEDYNQSGKNRDGIEFSLVYSDTRNFSRMIGNIAVAARNEKSIMKNCSEKYYASALTKLYAEYGTNISVTGVANYDFYPFRSRGLYGDQHDTDDASVVHPRANYRDKDVLKNDLLVRRKPCCNDCQANKEQVLTVFKTAQRDGDELMERRRIITSPLRNSFSTGTSLLPTVSLFAPPVSMPSTSGYRDTQLTPPVARRTSIKVTN